MELLISIDIFYNQFRDLMKSCTTCATNLDARDLILAFPYLPTNNRTVTYSARRSKKSHVTSYNNKKNNPPTNTP